jgi:Carboxypeptidase regulatory-like domain
MPSAVRGATIMVRRRCRATWGRSAKSARDIMGTPARSRAPMPSAAGGITELVRRRCRATWERSARSARGICTPARLRAPMPSAAGGITPMVRRRCRATRLGHRRHTSSPAVYVHPSGGIADVTVATTTSLRTTTAADGTFTLAGVAPGTYTLTARKDGYTFSDLLNVAVTNANLSG